MANLNVPFLLLQKDKIYKNYLPSADSFTYFSAKELQGYTKPPMRTIPRDLEQLDPTERAILVTSDVNSSTMTLMSSHSFSSVKDDKISKFLLRLQPQNMCLPDFQTQTLKLI